MSARNYSGDSQRCGSETILSCERRYAKDPVDSLAARVLLVIVGRRRNVVRVRRVRDGDAVSFRRPGTEIDQPAAFGAEGTPTRRRCPFDRCPAMRAGYNARRCHRVRDCATGIGCGARISRGNRRNATRGASVFRCNARGRSHTPLACNRRFTFSIEHKESQ